MDQKTYRAACRRAWLLVLAAVVYLVGFCALAVISNSPEPQPQWDMDGTPFVPASAPHAHGYPVIPGGGVRGLAGGDEVPR